MFIISPDVGPNILDQPITTGALLDPAPSFTNETNTATSVPLIDQGAAALNGISQTQVTNVLTAPRPSDPAAPSGKAASDQVQDEKSSTGLVVGVGIVILLIAWITLGKGK